MVKLVDFVIFNKFLAMISTEFHKYSMENEEFADKIPAKALVIFQVEGEDEFNKWHKETSLKNREPEQTKSSSLT